MMKIEEAKKLIVEALGSSFCKDKFKKLAVNIFNNLELYNENPKYGINTYNAFKDKIKSYQRIGKYKNEGKEIAVLTVQLKKKSSLDRARTMQRNFVAKYLDGSRNRVIDAAVVAFYHDDLDYWRLSFVKLQKKLSFDQEEGGVSIEKEITPARRYSFLVGQGEPSHTPCKQLLPIIQDDKNNPSLADIEEVFSVEQVTDEFFAKYKSHFLDLKDELERIVSNEPEIKKEFEEQNLKIVNFAKRIMSQLVFLYFIQKKGWLGVAKDAGWGEGSQQFLRKLYEKEFIDYDNFFNDILEPLFYEALAIDMENDNYYDKLKSRIPFLNGGLFEPINNYDWQGTDILIDNGIFEDVFATFDLYNFTIREDEPLEKEVAVDPEMLGNVFEKLLDVEDRKSKGAFYTPREIVHYMCQESLINYLETELEAKVEREEIETLIKFGDLAIENDKAKIEGSKSYEFKMPKSVRDNAKLIDDKLKEVKICDPAIGSGAFPVGIMKEIVRARSTLSIYLSEDNRNSYDFKRHAIQESIYGVDIDPGAVDIAKLRLWLSLVVDEENVEQIKPLPNLEYKIMQGNSLIEEFMGINLDYEFEQFNVENLNQNKEQSLFPKKEQMSLFESKDKILNESIKDFNKLNAIYFNVSNREKKKELRERINKLVVNIFREQFKVQKKEYSKEKKKIERQAQELKNHKDIKKYVRQKTKKLNERFNLKEVEAKLEEYVEGNKEKPFFLWKVYFADVFKDNGGFDIMIANPPYVSVKSINSNEKSLYSKKFKTGKGRFNLFTLFLEKGLVLLKNEGIMTYILPEGLYSNVEYRYIRKYILDNSKLLFSVLFSNRVFDADVDTSIISLRKQDYNRGFFDVFRDLDSKTITLDQNTLNNTPYNIFLVNLTIENKNIIKKFLINKSDKIKDILEIQQGIIYSGQPKKEVFSNYKENNKFKKILDGRDVLKWALNWSAKNRNKYIYYTDKLHRPREERLFLASEKLLIPRKSRKIVCAYDNEQYYALNTAYICLLKNNNYSLKYILTCLNSKLINYFYKNVFFGWQITIPALNSIPIKEVSSEEQQQFIEKADFMIEKNKKLIELNNITFKEIIEDYKSKENKKLSSITEEAKSYQQIYSGTATVVGKMEVKLDGNWVTIFSNERKLFKFQSENKYQAKYLKLYLEGLTAKDIERIDNYSGGIVNKVLQVEIPAYDNDELVKKIVKNWNEIKFEITELQEEIAKNDREIDQMVYDLYDLTDEEIKIVEENINSS